MDLALNNLQWLICHKTKPSQSNQTGFDEVMGLGYQNPFQKRHQQEAGAIIFYIL